MKLYFYGKTKEEAMDNCREFYDKAEQKCPDLFDRVISICVVDFCDPFPVVEDYKYRVFVEYSDFTEIAPTKEE